MAERRGKRQEEAERLGVAHPTDAPGAPDPLHEHGSDHPVTRTAPAPPSGVAPPTAGEGPAASGQSSRRD